jgi:hypothetical protein
MTTKAVASTHVMKKRTDEPDIYVDGGLPVLLPTAEAYAVGEPDTEAPPPEALDQIPVEVVGTFVASNDPDSIREHQPPKRQQQSSRSPPVVPPQWGVGLWKGCFRDVHCIHMVLYVAGLLYILLWILKSQNEAAPASCDVYLSCFWHKPGLAVRPLDHVGWTLHVRELLVLIPFFLFSRVDPTTDASISGDLYLVFDRIFPVVHPSILASYRKHFRGAAVPRKSLPKATYTPVED